jgi:hypothetical protein
MLMMRPFPWASHARHDGPRHPDQSEKVRLENQSGLIDRALFRSGRGNTEASIVHEQIDTAVALHDLADGCFHGFIVRHVEGQHLERLRACLGSPSAGAVNLVTGRREPLRCGLADARRGTGNDRDLCSDPVHKLLRRQRTF